MGERIVNHYQMYGDIIYGLPIFKKNYGADPVQFPTLKLPLLPPQGSPGAARSPKSTFF